MVLSLAVLVTIGGCGASKPSVRGVIVGVQAASLVEWETMTIRTAGGEEKTFRRGAGIDLARWRAAHLREHMTEGAAITVVYEQAGDVLTAVEIRD
ncbi:MAG: hypothetical protein EXR49_03690 [Dehalococcoidia bacterium]|nr:hypothetical protein [Dehalococcoidia bacterium]